MFSQGQPLPPEYDPAFAEAARFASSYAREPEPEPLEPSPPPGIGFHQIARGISRLSIVGLCVVAASLVARLWPFFSGLYVVMGFGFTGWAFYQLLFRRDGEAWLYVMAVLIGLGAGWWDGLQTLFFHEAGRVRLAQVGVISLTLLATVAIALVLFRSGKRGQR